MVRQACRGGAGVGRVQGQGPRPGSSPPLRPLSPSAAAAIVIVVFPLPCRDERLPPHQAPPRVLPGEDGAVRRPELPGPDFPPPGEVPADPGRRPLGIPPRHGQEALVRGGVGRLPPQLSGAGGWDQSAKLLHGQPARLAAGRSSPPPGGGAAAFPLATPTEEARRSSSRRKVEAWTGRRIRRTGGPAEQRMDGSAVKEGGRGGGGDPTAVSLLRSLSRSVPSFPVAGSENGDWTVAGKAKRRGS